MKSFQRESITNMPWWWPPGHIATALVWEWPWKETSRAELLSQPVKRGRPSLKPQHPASSRRVCNIGNTEQSFVLARFNLSPTMCECV